MKPAIALFCFLLLPFATMAEEHGPLVGLDYLQQVNQRIRNIDTAELERLIREEPELVVIDVRNENEINGLGGMIDARREVVLPRGWLEFRFRCVRR